MDMSMVNWLAVVVAALATFLIGGLWYSPALFYNAWLAANGFTKEQAESGSKGRAFGGSFVFALIMAANLAMFLADPKTDWVWGATAGFLAGFGWAAMAVGTVALFENRPWSYILINGGYHAVSFTVMGAILGAWR